MRLTSDREMNDIRLLPCRSSLQQQHLSGLGTPMNLVYVQKTTLWSISTQLIIAVCTLHKVQRNVRQRIHEDGRRDHSQPQSHHAGKVTAAENL